MVEEMLERLLRAEREACERYERLVKFHLSDERAIHAAHQICLETKAALERYKRDHPQRG